MVQVLPYVPGIGERIAPALEQAATTIGSAISQKRARTALDKLLNPQQEQQSEQGTPVQKMNQVAEQQINQPRKIKAIDFPLIEQLAEKGYPGSSKILTEVLRDEQKQAAKEASALRLAEVKHQNAKEKELFKSNEPKVVELGKELQTLETEDARYARLQQIFSDPSKFPSPFVASLLSKEGQISPAFASQLSPEAQESIKLTIDSLSGAQNTFGGKVSNFEAATYLKRNATLFNTPEGRERILTDLRALNELNRKYAEGILQIFEDKGGTDKISFSSAERIFRSQHKQEIEDLKERFIKGPESRKKGQFDPAKHKGRKIQDEETGEILESNGEEWVPIQVTK